MSLSRLYGLCKFVPMHHSALKSADSAKKQCLLMLNDSCLHTRMLKTTYTNGFDKNCIVIDLSWKIQFYESFLQDVRNYL